MNTCPHLTKSGLCSLALALTGPDAEPRPHHTACAFCSDRAEPPQALNEVVVSLALGAVAKDAAKAASIQAAHGHRLRREDSTAANAARLAAVEAGLGVGSQLWRLLASLGIKHSATCSCLTTAEHLNRAGPAACRDQRRQLADQLRDNAAAYGWTALASAALRAIASGLAWKLNPLDLYASLLDEAIARAEAAGATATPRRKLILTTPLCPGDLLTLTAALESLHATYPGQYQTDVRTRHPGIWTANPWVEPIADGDPEAVTVEMHYPSIGECNQVAAPFLAGYTRHLAEAIKRPIPLRTNRPHLYLTAEEARRPRSRLWPGAPDLTEPFWILNAGIKRDFTAKAWPLEYYQEIIDRTAGKIRWVQIGLPSDLHRPLRGAVNLIEANPAGPPMRELILLAHHAAGAIGPVTFLQHLAAAWQKPYLAIAGGREPATWIQYPYQHTFHSVGALDCCRPHSCWKARVVPLNDGDDKDRSLCKYPVTEGLERPAGRCLTMIEPAEVLLTLNRIL